MTLLWALQRWPRLITWWVAILYTAWLASQGRLAWP